jgi:hypothetical protein
MRHSWAIALAALFVAVSPSIARGQHSLFETGNDTDFLAGLRLARHGESGFGIGGNFDWVFADRVDLPLESGGGNIDFNVMLYSAEVDYTFPSAGRTNFFIGAGVGGATERVTDIPPSGGDESNTNLLVPVFGGFKVHNRSIGPTWAFRVDVRDNLIWRDEFSLSEVSSSNGDTEVQNNWEVTAGLSFFFGGGPPQPPPPSDSDGDGVYDNRDQCPNTAVGIRVDSFGCPVPIDSDGDGVSDDRDQCPATPVGTLIDAEGCPVVEEPEPEPEPVVSCADGRDWYRYNDTISVDGRNWIQFGSAATLPIEDLMQIGEYDGVPVYVPADARPPYTKSYVPLCAPKDAFQPYQVDQGVRGTTG